MRPPELAQDDSPMLPVIQHALQASRSDAEVVVLLQPTSPSKDRAQWVLAALALMADESAPTSVVSLVEIPERYRPDLAVRLVNERWLTPFTFATRRQDARRAFYRDGTVYASRRWTIDNGDLYGPTSVPLFIGAGESVTIDSEADWREAEARHG